MTKLLVVFHTSEGQTQRPSTPIGPRSSKFARDVHAVVTTTTA